ESDLDSVVLQPTIIVRPYDYNSYSQIFNMVKNKGVSLCFSGTIGFCHSEDVADAHIAAFEKGRTKDRYLLCGDYRPWIHFFQEIAKLVGKTPPKKPTSLPVLYTIAFFSKLYAD